MNKNNVDQVLDYWDRTAGNFDAIYTGAKPAWSRVLDRLLRRDMYQRFAWTFRNSGDLGGRSVCDFGCGTGRYVVEYGRRGADRVVGIDGAHTMVVQANLNITEAGLTDRCSVREQPILESREDEVFDITLAAGVFDYIREPLPYLRVIREMTGWRFLSTWPRFWTHRMPLRKVRLACCGCPVYFFTKDRIRSLLSHSGFDCERIDVIGALFCVIASPLRKTGIESGTAEPERPSMIGCPSN